MGGDASAVVARARACVGTRFRPQGRLSGVGLDCVGVVAWAAGVRAPGGYDWRGGGVERVERELERLGFRQVAEPRGGDVIVIEPAAGMRHLGVLTGEGTVVHAHAGLRRVVEGPVDPDWRVVGVWRLG